MTAFFITLNILFVPFLAFAFRLSIPKLVDGVVVILGVIIVLISFHGSLSHFASGDIFGLIAAFAIAMNIVTVQFVTKNAEVNKLLLAFFSILFSMVFLAYFPLTITTAENVLMTPSIGLAVLYLGCVSTALAYLLQMLFQKQVGTTRTAVILNLDLVFAGLFGLVNGELLSWSQVLGGIIALCAALFHDIFSTIKAWLTTYFRLKAKPRNLM